MTNHTQSRAQAKLVNNTMIARLRHYMVDCQREWHLCGVIDGRRQHWAGSHWNFNPFCLVLWGRLPGPSMSGVIPLQIYYILLDSLTQSSEPTMFENQTKLLTDSKESTFWLSPRARLLHRLSTKRQGTGNPTRPPRITITEFPIDHVAVRQRKLRSGGMYSSTAPDNFLRCKTSGKQFIE